MVYVWVCQEKLVSIEVSVTNNGSPFLALISMYVCNHVPRPFILKTNRHADILVVPHFYLTSITVLLDALLLKHGSNNRQDNSTSLIHEKSIWVLLVLCSSTKLFSYFSVMFHIFAIMFTCEGYNEEHMLNHMLNYCVLLRLKVHCNCEDTTICIR